MWPFKKKPKRMYFQPDKSAEPKDWVGPLSFADWSASEIDYVSKAIRSHGQPESEGFRRFARVALNTLRGGSAAELVARAIEESANPGSDPDRPICGGHYMHGMPHWMMWLEYAKPAVAAIIERSRKPDTGL
jgi:hypothetical protein